MTTQQNAPVLDKHEREVKRLFIINLWEREFAQTLANLEAARAENADLTNRLAEIDRIAKRRTWESGGVDFKRVAAIASGHTPSPCPSCAAKDEAMAAFRREVSDAIVEFGKSSRFDVARTAESYHSHLSRFILPPADPVAEALKAAVHAYGGELIEGENFDRAVAELKSRLPLGGAK